MTGSVCFISLTVGGAHGYWLSRFQREEKSADGSAQSTYAGGVGGVGGVVMKFWLRSFWRSFGMTRAGPFGQGGGVVLSSAK